MSQLDNEQRLWHILLGAMIASKPVRDDATKKLLLDEVPKDLAGLWDALEKGDRAGVMQVFRCLDVDVWADGVLPSIVRHMQQRSMKVFCQNTIARAEMTALQSPQELIDKFMSLISKLQARQDRLEKSQAEGRKAAADAELKTAGK